MSVGSGGTGAPGGHPGDGHAPDRHAPDRHAPERHAPDRHAPDRRRFLQASLGAACGALAGVSLSACAAIPPGILDAGVPASRAGRRIDVRTRGARGDGRNDDTFAIQSAIDALAGTGGVVDIPAGSYRIDALKSIRLRSRVHLRLASGARLVAQPNAAERSYVLLAHQVSDVVISGGEIVGERDAHLGRTGEWGHGIGIRGCSRVTVRDMRISRCWGDGMSIGGASIRKGDSAPSTDIIVERVRCLGNRRQGLTIGRSQRVRVRDCEFSDTHGTKPEYGIDIEPDRPGVAQDIVIERCTLRNNRGGGIQVYHRVSDVAIRDCLIERNGYGVYVQVASGVVVERNRIRANRLAGVGISRQTRNVRVSGNRFGGNSGGRSGAARKGQPASRGHIQVAKDALNVVVGANDYET